MFSKAPWKQSFLVCKGDIFREGASFRFASCLREAGLQGTGCPAPAVPAHSGNVLQEQHGSRPGSERQVCFSPASNTSGLRYLLNTMI